MEEPTALGEGVEARLAQVSSDDEKQLIGQALEGHGDDELVE